MDTDRVIETGPMSAQDSEEGLKSVPMMLQDPVTLMIHFILSLPINIEKGKLSTRGLL